MLLDGLDDFERSMDDAADVALAAAPIGMRSDALAAGFRLHNRQ